MKKQSLVAFNKAWSDAVFAQHGAMTAEQFVEHAGEYLFGDGSEGIHENICQCQSEINMFGDSGPGSMLRLGEQVADFNRVADRYTALTGQVVQRPRMPYYPVSNDDMFDDDRSFYG